MKGTEAAAFAKRGGFAKPSPPKTSWRKKHEDFIAAVRSAREASKYEAAGGNLADLPPPPRSENPDYVQYAAGC